MVESHGSVDTMATIDVRKVGVDEGSCHCLVGLGG